MKQAEAVVEFAKANGFPNARWYLWDEDGECGYDATHLAVDDLVNGEQADFEIRLHLGGITLRQEVSEVNGIEYSNGVEVDP